MPRTAEGRDAMGEASKDALRVGFDGSLKLGIDDIRKLWAPPYMPG